MNFCKFDRYRTGPGVVPSKVPTDVKQLVIVLNGRTADKVEYAQMWLTYIPAMESLQNVILVILGECLVSLAHNVLQNMHTILLFCSTLFCFLT